MCYLRAICVSFGCVLSPPYPLADSTRLSARCARPDGSQIASHYLRPPPASPSTTKKGVQLLPVVDSVEARDEMGALPQFAVTPFHPDEARAKIK